jgi:hypothetical protein
LLELPRRTSTSTFGAGAYADYLTQELVPFVDREFRTLASRDHRGCFGKSSGGYGAMIHGMKYAKYWGAIANHSGDAYFDYCYLTDWPRTLNELDRYRRPRRQPGKIDVVKDADGTGEGYDDGRIRRFLDAIWSKEKLNDAEGHALMEVCMAASYDPDPDAPLGSGCPSIWKPDSFPRAGSNGRSTTRSISSASTGTTCAAARHLHGLRLARPVSSALRRAHTFRRLAQNGSSTRTRSSTTPTRPSITAWMSACRFSTGH